MIVSEICRVSLETRCIFNFFVCIRFQFLCQFAASLNYTQLSHRHIDCYFPLLLFSYYKRIVARNRFTMHSTESNYNTVARLRQGYVTHLPLMLLFSHTVCTFCLVCRNAFCRMARENRFILLHQQHITLCRFMKTVLYDKVALSNVC